MDPIPHPGNPDATFRALLMKKISRLGIRVTEHRDLAWRRRRWRLARAHHQPEKSSWTGIVIVQTVPDTELGVGNLRLEGTGLRDGSASKSSRRKASRSKTRFSLGVGRAVLAFRSNSQLGEADYDGRARSVLHRASKLVRAVDPTGGQPMMTSALRVLNICALSPVGW